MSLLGTFSAVIVRHILWHVSFLFCYILDNSDEKNERVNDNPGKPVC